MNTKSIYSGHQSIQSIQSMASELQTAEQLVVMGYKSSCGQNLQDRIKYLDEEIARQEKLLKRGRYVG